MEVLLYESISQFYCIFVVKLDEFQHVILILLCRLYYSIVSTVKIPPVPPPLQLVSLFTLFVLIVSIF